MKESPYELVHTLLTVVLEERHKNFIMFSKYFYFLEQVVSVQHSILKLINITHNKPNCISQDRLFELFKCKTYTKNLRCIHLKKLNERKNFPRPGVEPGSSG